MDGTPDNYVNHIPFSYTHFPRYTVLESMYCSSSYSILVPDDVYYMLSVVGANTDSIYKLRPVPELELLELESMWPD